MQTMEHSAAAMLSAGGRPMDPSTRVFCAPGEVTNTSTSALIQQAVADEQALGGELARLFGAVSQQHALLRRRLDDIIQHLAAQPSSDTALPLAPAAPMVAVRCLGGFELTIDGQSQDLRRAGRARGLFQYLVVHRGQLISRDLLIEALWPDPDALAPGTSLKVAVHALRQLLGQVPGLAVVAQESGYQLQAPGLWLDVEQFEQLCRLGQRLEAKGEPTAARAAFASAAELYAGNFLPEVWADWAVFRREGLKDQHLYVLARLADAALAEHDWHACIRWAQLILDQDCCREDAFRLLLLAHARLGQPSRVRRWFEVCREVLHKHLDCEPSHETVQLYEAALRGGPSTINPSVTGH